MRNRRNQIVALSTFLVCIFSIGLLFTQIPQIANAANNDFTVSATNLYSQLDLQYINVDTSNPRSVPFTLNNTTSLWISVTTTVSGATVKLNPPKGDPLGTYFSRQGLIPPGTIDPAHKSDYTALFTAANQSVQAAATPYGLAQKLTMITAFFQVTSKLGGVDLLPIIFQARSGDLLSMLIAMSKLPSFVKFWVDFHSYIKTNQVKDALDCIVDVIHMIEDANKMKAFDAVLVAGVGKVIAKEVVTPLLKAIPIIKQLTFWLELHKYVPLFYAYVRPFQGQFFPNQPAILRLKSVATPTPTPTPITSTPTPITPTPTPITPTPTPTPITSCLPQVITTSITLTDFGSDAFGYIQLYNPCDLAASYTIQNGSPEWIDIQQGDCFYNTSVCGPYFIAPNSWYTINITRFDSGGYPAPQNGNITITFANGGPTVTIAVNVVANNV